MESTTEELLGSLSGAVKTEGGSKFTKAMKKAFGKICRKLRKQEINIIGGSVNLILVDCSKEEIDNLIMEYNGIVNGKKL